MALGNPVKGSFNTQTHGLRNHCSRQQLGWSASKRFKDFNTD